MSARCVQWCMLCGNTGFSRHKDPVFPQFCPLNQNLACVRAWERGTVLAAEMIKGESARMAASSKWDRHQYCLGPTTTNVILGREVCHGCHVPRVLPTINH